MSSCRMCWNSTIVSGTTIPTTTPAIIVIATAPAPAADGRSSLALVLLRTVDASVSFGIAISFFSFTTFSVMFSKCIGPYKIMSSQGHKHGSSKK